MPRSHPHPLEIHKRLQIRSFSAQQMFHKLNTPLSIPTLLQLKHPLLWNSLFSPPLALGLWSTHQNSLRHSLHSLHVVFVHMNQPFASKPSNHCVSLLLKELTVESHCYWVDDSFFEETAFFFRKSCFFVCILPVNLIEALDYFVLW